MGVCLPLHLRDKVIDLYTAMTQIFMWVLQNVVLHDCAADTSLSQPSFRPELFFNSPKRLIANDHHLTEANEYLTMFQRFAGDFSLSHIVHSPVYFISKRILSCSFGQQGTQLKRQEVIQWGWWSR